MKCFVVVLLFALVAIAMAEEKKLPKVEEAKEPQIADIPRDKRGLAYYSPYTYGLYPRIGYNSLYPIYQPYAYPHNYRSFYTQPYYY